MEQAVYELATARPHVPEGMAFTLHESIAYERGYCAALQRALAVMVLRRATTKLNNKTLRVPAAARVA